MSIRSSWELAQEGGIVKHTSSDAAGGSVEHVFHPAPDEEFAIIRDDKQGIEAAVFIKKDADGSVVGGRMISKWPAGSSDFKQETMYGEDGQALTDKQMRRINGLRAEDEH